MKIKLSEIIADFRESQLFDSFSGDEIFITGFAGVEDCGDGDVVFVEHETLMSQALQASPALIVTTALLAEKFKEASNTAFLISQNVRLAQALLRQTYVDRDLRNIGWDRLHSTAVVHESACLADDVFVGPGAIVSRDVQLGAGVVVMANVVVEDGAKVGAGTVIHPNAVIGYNCHIGERCIIKAGCIIGMEGFGFAQDQQRKSHRIPHLGNVVIGDDVVLGANCNVDRGVFKETRIGNGCKLDALCHIAHNVELGENCLLAAQTCIAGSTRVGDRAMCSGQTGILDHLTITSDVVLTQRAGVIKDIDQPGVYAGHPVQPVRQYFKNIALLAKLSDKLGRLKEKS